MKADKHWAKRLAAAVASLVLGSGYLNAATCRAIDGDTLICGRQKVRLANVYAAELSEPGGPDAKARLAALVRGAHVVISPVARDKYGRTVAQVSVGGRVISQSDIGARGGVGADYVPWQRHARLTPPLTVLKLSSSRPTKAQRAKSPALSQPFSGAYKKPRNGAYVRPHLRRDGRYVSGHRRRG